MQRVLIPWLGAALLAPAVVACGSSSPPAPEAATQPASIEPPAAKAGAQPAVQAAEAKPSEETGTGLLPPGAAAPDLLGRTAAGQALRLSEQKGMSVVYFYPKDATPGCTVEAQAFRDAAERYAEAGVTVFGVSRDDEASHRTFQTEHDLPFALVPDVDGRIQRAYGVPSIMGMALAARVTFLVDAKGKVAHVWQRVEPASHAEEVLARATSMRHGQ